MIDLVEMFRFWGPGIESGEATLWLDESEQFGFVPVTSWHPLVNHMSLLYGGFTCFTAASRVSAPAVHNLKRGPQFRNCHDIRPFQVLSKSTDLEIPLPKSVLWIGYWYSIHPNSQLKVMTTFRTEGSPIPAILTKQAWYSWSTHEECALYKYRKIRSITNNAFHSTFHCSPRSICLSLERISEL